MAEDRKLRFDPTMNWGHVLTAATIAIGGAGVAATFQSRLGAVEMRMERIEAATAGITQLMVNDARRDERMTSIEKRLDRVDQKVTAR